MEYELVYGLPKAEVLAQMAEEFTEAVQAALKLRRAMDAANPTPISVDTGMKNWQIVSFARMFSFTGWRNSA